MIKSLKNKKLRDWHETVFKYRRITKESPFKENWHNDIGNSLEDASNSGLTRGRITKSDNVVSINLAIELGNVENNAPTINEVVKGESVAKEIWKSPFLAPEVQWTLKVYRVCSIHVFFKCFEPRPYLVCHVTTIENV